jgi:hypothetical protein
MTLRPFILAAACVAVAGCGQSASPTVVDGARIERAIAKSSLDQRGLNARVTCPRDVRQKKGRSFSCTAVVGRRSTRFEVTQVDGHGRVHYEAR